MEYGVDSRISGFNALGSKPDIRHVTQTESLAFYTR
jgi:hypothetical protein